MWDKLFHTPLWFPFTSQNTHATCELAIGDSKLCRIQGVFVLSVPRIGFDQDAVTDDE